MSVDEVWDWQEVAQRLAGREPVAGVVGKEGRGLLLFVKGKWRSGAKMDLVGDSVVLHANGRGKPWN